MLLISHYTIFARLLLLSSCGVQTLSSTFRVKPVLNGTWLQRKPALLTANFYSPEYPDYRVSNIQVSRNLPATEKILVTVVLLKAGFI